MGIIIEHQDKVLTNHYLTYFQSRNIFKSDKVFIPDPVTESTGKYYELLRLFQKLYKTSWKPGTKKRQVDFQAILQAYQTFTHALEGKYTKDDLDNFPEIDLKLDIVEGLAESILISKEYASAIKAFTQGSYPAANRTQLIGGQQWNTTTGDPLTVITDGQFKLIETCGNMGNAVIMGFQVWQKLIRSPSIVGQLQYTKGKGITEADIIGLLPGIEEVHIGMTVYDNSSRKATEAPVMTPLWGKHCLVYYKPPSLRPKTPAYGINWRKTGYEGQTRSYQDARTEAFFVDIKDSFSPSFKCVNNSTDKQSVAGYFIEDAVA